MNPMLLLFLAVLPALAFVLGVLVARSGKQPDKLTSRERKELNSYRNLVGELTSMAGEHVALGDQFAVLALDKINDQRRELQ